MIPTNQTKHHNPPTQKGNCFAACVASIFEVPIEEVPQFEEHFDWNNTFDWWSELKRFAEKYGREPKCFYVGHEEKEQVRLLAHQLDEKLNTGETIRSRLPKGYSILSGASPNCPEGQQWDHCVVALDGEPVFDPAPWSNGRKLLNYLDWIWFEEIKNGLPA